MSLSGRLLNHRLSSRQLLIAAFLLPVFALVHVAAYWLRFEGQLAPAELNQIRICLPWVLLAKTIAFVSWGVYRSWSRFVTFHDLLVLVKAATVSSLLIAFVDYIVLVRLAVPRSVFLMDWGGTVFVVGGLRSVVRLVEEGALWPMLQSRRTPVFIVGVNDSGEALLRAIRRNRRLAIRVIGFISEERAQCGEYVGGVPVLGTLDEVCQLAEKHDVHEVLITAGELTGQQVRGLVEAGREHSISVKVLPSYEQLLQGHIDLRPREVSIEDLLRRDPVELDMEELRDWIEDRVLLVTGSAGSIGSEICRQLLHFAPRKLVLVDQSETGQFFLDRELRALAGGVEIDVRIADVCDVMRMRQIFVAHRPDIVFHAAAYKHVPLMEKNPGEAIRNISHASRVLADISHEFNVSSFVMISTDKAVNPTSVMGACKRVAEMYVQALSSKSDCRFVIVRFGNVLGSAGSVIPIFREQIERGGPITVTHPEMTRYFMTIPEASQLVIQAGAMGRGGEILVLDMGEPVKIVDLAEDMIRLSGLQAGADIEIEYTGMRPGEKLFEELYLDGEEHAVTSHRKIMVVKSRPGEYGWMKAALDRLVKHALAPEPLIVDELQSIVPGYRGAAPQRQRRAA